MVVRQKLRRRLSDPWDWLVASFCGGLGWAALAGVAPTGVPVVAGLGIGAVVLGTAVLLPGPRRRSRSARRTVDRFPVPSSDSPAGALLRRADSAVVRIEVLAEAPGDEWLRDEMLRVVEEAQAARVSLDLVAGRVTLVAQSIDDAQVDRLTADVERLKRALNDEADPRLGADTREALEAVENQRVLAARLQTLHDSMLRRMETAVTGLEGLSARASEIVAIGTSVFSRHETYDRIEGLTDELEVLRSGLDEIAPLP